jgi:hypothetical protein
MKKEQSFKVRDKRNKGWFWVENDFFNVFGKVLGSGSIAVYVCLCRHADNDQKCFPSQKTIAEETKLSERTVRKIIKELEKYRIIEITKERDKKGKWINNTYWLLDKSEWIYPEEIISDGKPAANNDEASGNQRHSQRHLVPTNNTNNNNTHNNNTHNNILYATSKEIAGKEINELISLFKEINPTYERLFVNKTQRQALERLVKKFGKEKLANLIKMLPKIIGKPYAPRITTPLQLEQKLADLIVYLKQEKNKKPSVAIFKTK